MAAKKVMNRKKAHRGPRLPWLTLAVIFTLITFILVAGFLYTQQQVSQIKTEKMNELRAIAKLKTSQIRHWLDEILDDGRFLQSNMSFNAMLMKNSRIKPADFQSIFSTWIKALKDVEGFEEIHFLDLQTQPVWPAAVQTAAADPESVSELQAIFATGKISLSDLYFSNTLKRNNLSLRVPVTTFSAAGQAQQTVFLLSVDPNRFLFPLIQNWPTASPSAETLLVRREGEEVVYLNELRHRQNTALKLRFPISHTELLAVRAALGYEGFLEGNDYRGMSVIADIHRVPGTSWSLVAKIDQAEVHDLVTRQEWVMYVLVVSAFLLIILSIAYSWRRQQVKQLYRQTEMDTTLRQSEERYRMLIENQGEGIGLVDIEDRFIFANPAAEILFGVQPGRLTGRSLREFLSTRDFEKIREKTAARSSTGKESYELTIAHPDGSAHILFVTVTPRHDENNHFSGTFGIFRDITEIKRNEEMIHKMLAEKELLLKEVHHRVKNNLMVIGSLLQIQAQRVGDPKTTAVLQDSQNRIQAMTTIYEKLYRTTDLTHIGLRDYFSELARSIFAAYNLQPGMIKLETAISDIALDIDRTIPCGLIINELVSNTLKYAFPDGRQGRIRIEFNEIETDNCKGTPPPSGTDKSRPPKSADDLYCLSVDKSRRAPTYALTVANDGVPLPAGFAISTCTGFGLKLVSMLASQLGGEFAIGSRAETEFMVTFPRNPEK